MNRMRVVLVTGKVDSLTFTLVRAMSEQGLSVEVCFESNRADSFLGAVKEVPNVRLWPYPEVPKASGDERILVQAHPFFPAKNLLHALSKSSPKGITLITAGDNGRSWRQAFRLQRKEYGALKEFGFRPERVAYKDGPRRFDFYALRGCSRSVVGFDVHSQFLRNPELFKAAFYAPWDPERFRPFRASFLGCLDPPSRRGFLPQLRPLFRSEDMFWHEYSDRSGSGVSARRYLRILEDSDFALCPPGYSLVTHRPLEALLKGSIPVLNASETGLYGIDLQDGKNCIAVRRNDWVDAVQRIRKMDTSDVLSLRRNIHGMQERLRYERTSLEMCRRLGVL